MGGPLPITFTDMASYCYLRGINSLSEKEDLIYYMRLLDGMWIEDYYQKTNPDSKGKKK